MFYMYIYLQAVSEIIETQIVHKEWDVKDEDNLSYRSLAFWAITEFLNGVSILHDRVVIKGRNQ